MNCAAGLVVPLIGSLAPFYCGALWIALFWDTVLLTAIWFRHDWARFVLAGFLICFDVGLLLFISEASGRCPSLRGEGVNVLVLLSLTNALAAGFILGSIDIISISRPMSPKDD
ncbi:MAG: hypothetical protein NTZ46_03975 [Verrucomicrobia bacterium]|nr:hypothetical protein [Verrucomicrobiota bacterium]